MRRAAVESARLVFVLFGGLATLFAATGWLYLLRPHVGLGGPRVGDALPLDELPHASSVPFPVFLAVWIVAATVLGLVARSARTERLTAGLLSGLAVAVWTYLTTGVSILVIRQIPAAQAFHSAATTRAVVVPPLVAGIAAAFLGRRHASSRARAPHILAWFVAAAGVVSVIDAVQPRHQATLLNVVAPDSVPPVARALVAPLGLALVVAARGLARRKRRAWELALVLLVSGTVLHVLYGFRIGALAAGFLTVALIARRADFDAPGDPSRRLRLVFVGVGSFLAILVYGAVVIWINRLMADRPYSLGFAVHETLAALVALRVHGSQHLAGEFSEWFPDSVLVLGLSSAAWLVSLALAPWRHRVRQQDRERALARTSSTRGERIRSLPSCCAPTSRTSSARTNARSSPTELSAASRSSRAIRSARRLNSMTSSHRSSPTHDVVAGGSRFSERPRRGSTSTGATACTRSTTATRRWST